MENTNKRLKIVRIILMFWTLFISLGAFLGGYWMLADPTGKAMGMDAMLPYFQVLPFADVLFQDFIFSGISLIIVNGISNLIAFIFLCLKKRLGYILGTIFGFTLILWICIQFVIFEPNIMDTLYFTFGMLQLITGVIALIYYQQTQFFFHEDDYNISHDSSVLVVFFSRMGYTKKLAYEMAVNNNADIFEITTVDNVHNTLGFWWCGRFGMHRWGMKINPITIDLNQYSRIIVVTPIWVFRICAPIREFLVSNKDKIKKVAFVFNHFNPHLPSRAIVECQEILNINHIDYQSWITHYGKTKRTKDN